MTYQEYFWKVVIKAKREYSRFRAFDRLDNKGVLSCLSGSLFVAIKSLDFFGILFQGSFYTDIKLEAYEDSN